MFAINHMFGSNDVMKLWSLIAIAWRQIRDVNDLVDLINEAGHICALRLITFCKLTPEFNSLHEDDRLTLVKHNLLPILYIHFFVYVAI